MHESPMTEAHKSALIVAYYLSRFDRKGIRLLGYRSFSEAFTKIGQTLGVPSSTVKHMRDSFDPYCSHVRVGWYQRKILPSRANIIQAYNDLSEDAMVEIVRELLSGEQEVREIYTAPISRLNPSTEFNLAENIAFANRLRTGEDAELFFMKQFQYLTQFNGSVLEDTRKLGIGFDFRASFPDSYQAIEVKGIREPQGYISFTDKEWSVARILKADYLLALVRSLEHMPVLDLIPNPTLHLSAKMQTVESVSVYWSAKV